MVGRAVLPIVVLAVVAGCGGGGEKGPTPAGFSGGGISFSHPSSWRTQFVDNRGIPYTRIVVALSTEKLHVPCEPGGGGTGCGFRTMLRTLPPGGVFVAWFERGGPGQGSMPLQVGGVRMRIGGRAATVAVDPSGVVDAGFCPTATTGSVAALIGPPGLPVNMVACTHGDSAGFKAQVLAMLRSVSFRAK